MALKNQLHRVRYFCSDAWDEWRHSLGVNLMALLTLVSALFVAGLIMLIVGNIERRVETLRDEAKIEVYLKDGHEETARLALVRHLGTTERVLRVEYVDKDEALRRYREWAADLAELVNELQSNPLPASLEVFLAPGAGSPQVAASIATDLRGNGIVEDVRFNADWLQRLEGVLGLARIGGGVVVLLVSLAVVLVMGSVLRLAVYARRDEIGIMQLVGATPGFIRGPYLVAGAAQGLVASLLALLMVEGVRSGAAASVDANAAALLELVAARPLSAGMAGVLLLLGVLVSLTGAFVSVRQSV
jgi:cell division transport system permease protein